MLFSVAVASIYIKIINLHFVHAILFLIFDVVDYVDYVYIELREILQHAVVEIIQHHQCSLQSN